MAMLRKDQTSKKKSLSFSFNTFSGIPSEQCLTPWLYARAHTSRQQWWQFVGNLWKIW